MKPLLRGHPDERPPPLERPLDNVNLNINILIFTPDESPPLLKGHFSDAKGMASQEGFHCTFVFLISNFIKDLLELYSIFNLFFIYDTQQNLRSTGQGSELNGAYIKSLPGMIDRTEEKVRINNNFVDSCHLIG